VKIIELHHRSSYTLS